MVTEQTFANAYVIQVLSLRCIRPWGLAGDAVALTFNGREIWSSGRRKMRSLVSLNEEGYMTRFDFAGALLADASDLPAQIGLRRGRRLGGSMRLGEICVTMDDGDHGVITAILGRGGARYALSYSVARGSLNANRETGRPLRDAPASPRIPTAPAPLPGY